MKKELIITGDITEDEKSKLIETLKYLDTEMANTFEIRYKNSRYELEVKVTATQILADVKKLT